MPWTISIVLLSLWVLGITTPSTFHGYIHILLAAAVATTVIPILRHRRRRVD
jgi:hypothetical protein